MRRLPLRGGLSDIYENGWVFRRVESSLFCIPGLGPLSRHICASSQDVEVTIVVQHRYPEMERYRSD